VDLKKKMFDEASLIKFKIYQEITNFHKKIAKKY